MRHTCRRFGPNDTAKLEDIAQTGAAGIVSALHHVSNGTVWSPEDITRRQDLIERRSDGSPSTLSSDVVESLPVSEDTDRGTMRSTLESGGSAHKSIIRAAFWMSRRSQSMPGSWLLY